MDKNIEKKIKMTKTHIEALAKSQDHIYDCLLRELNLERESEAEEWLFDYLFNNTEHSYTKLKQILS